MYCKFLTDSSDQGETQRDALASYGFFQPHPKSAKSRNEMNVETKDSHRIREGGSPKMRFISVVLLFSPVPKGQPVRLKSISKRMDSHIGVVRAVRLLLIVPSLAPNCHERRKQPPFFSLFILLFELTVVGRYELIKHCTSAISENTQSVRKGGSPQLIRLINSSTTPLQGCTRLSMQSIPSLGVRLWP